MLLGTIYYFVLLVFKYNKCCVPGWFVLQECVIMNADSCCKERCVVNHSVVLFRRNSCVDEGGIVLSV